MTFFCNWKFVIELFIMLFYPYKYFVLIGTAKSFVYAESGLKGRAHDLQAQPASRLKPSSTLRGSRPSPGSYLGSNRSKYPQAKNDIINLCSNHNAIGIDARDIFTMVCEEPLENWGIGCGIPACDLDPWLQCQYMREYRHD